VFLVTGGTAPGMGAMRILIAEDEHAIRELLDHHLTQDGFRCLHALEGITALGVARDGVDLAILDIGLPRLDGLEVARTLRREGRRVPILILTARTEEIDRVVGFEIGADDYVTKPFLPREIVARVRAILRRTGVAFEAGPRVLRFDRLVIDEAAREARVDGNDVGLKPREFALLLELASNPGVALSRSALLERVWGYDYEGDERTVDVHVRRLRAKIEERHAIGAAIATVHGFGYKFARS
jgi:DNA-binding response OmpR family regulator